MTAPAISIKWKAPLINKEYNSNQYLQIIILEKNKELPNFSEFQKFLN